MSEASLSVGCFGFSLSSFFTGKVVGFGAPLTVL